MMLRKSIMLLIGTATKVAALKEAMSAAEAKADTERTEREKKDARVGEVQQERPGA